MGLRERRVSRLWVGRVGRAVACPVGDSSMGICGTEHHRRRNACCQIRQSPAANQLPATATAHPKCIICHLRRTCTAVMPSMSTGLVRRPVQGGRQ